MKIQNSGFPSIEQLTDQYLNNSTAGKTAKTETGMSFEEILQEKSSAITGENAVRFSKHASTRLSDRNIELSNAQLERLNEGAQKAGRKGIHESLVLVDDLAFIVNIKNNTVVTAMDQTETNENVFTNIDGTVII